MSKESAVKFDEYYFIKVTDKECVKAKTDEEAVVKAIQNGIVDPKKFDDYVVVTCRCINC